jgi:hypothetical protein
VGVFCLERAQVGQDLDFVRREIDSLVYRVKDVLQSLPEQTQNQVAAKIGTGEGQVLAPVQKLVNDVSKAASDKIEDIRGLLQQEVDPTKEASALGKALQALRNLLDPNRTDSVQGCLAGAVGQVTGEAGPLAKAVTGFANYEATLGGKWLELLSEIAPGLKRAAIMFNPDINSVSVYMPSFATAARSLKVGRPRTKSRRTEWRPRIDRGKPVLVHFCGELTIDVRSNQCFECIGNISILITASFGATLRKISVRNDIFEQLFVGTIA